MSLPRSAVIASGVLLLSAAVASALFGSTAVRDTSVAREHAHEHVHHVSAPRVTASAHRCGGGQWAQDSLDACRRAIDAGYPEIEADAWVTTDGVAVVYHDETIDPARCTGQPNRRVRELTYRQLATVRCDGQPIPTLHQLLDLVADSDVTLRLEVKMYHGQPAAQARAWATQVSGAVDVAGLSSRTIMQDFTWSAIAAMHAVNPTLRVSALTSKRPSTADVSRAARLGAYDLSYDVKWSTRGLNRAITRAGLVPTVWNTDPVPEHPGHASRATLAAARTQFVRAVDTGARVVITNYPGIEE